MQNFDLDIHSVMTSVQRDFPIFFSSLFDLEQTENTKTWYSIMFFMSSFTMEIEKPPLKSEKFNKKINSYCESKKIQKTKINDFN